MQPYFIPYIGYWQLLSEVDVFVIANDTKYTKQSWINRNRLILNNIVSYSTLPLKGASDFALICERQISNTFNFEKEIKKISQAYSVDRSSSHSELLWDIYSNPTRSLDLFLKESILRICEFLKIETATYLATEFKIPKSLMKADRIFYLGDVLGIRRYVNLPGGRNLYSKKEFDQHSMSIQFIEPKLLPYSNERGDMPSNLSILHLILTSVNDGDLATHLRNYNVD